MNSGPVPPPPFRLRPASNPDTEEIKALVFSILNEYGLLSDPEDLNAELEDIAGQYIEQGGGFFLLLDGNGVIAGTVGIYPLEDKVCELCTMYLRKEHRSKGLGTFLMEFSLAEARRLGFKKMLLETNSLLKEAIGLYEKYGFKQIPKASTYERCDKVYELDLDRGGSNFSRDL